MRPPAIFLISIALCIRAWGSAPAHLPETQTYYAVQFPDPYLPTVDGDLSEWDIVPNAYAISNSEAGRSMIEVLTGSNADLSDLAVRCIIGWNDSSNRLYFALEVFDDVHQVDRSDPEALWTDDSWEIIVDADHSGGQFAGFSDLNEEEAKRRTGAQATRYLFAEPPVSGIGFVVENAGTWMFERGRLFDVFDVGWWFTGPGESIYSCEAFIVPFDDLNWEGQSQSRVHNLREGEILGIGIGVRDFDDTSDQPETYWNLTGADSGYVYADRLADVYMSPRDPALPGWGRRPPNRKFQLRRVLGDHGFLDAREIRTDTYVVPGDPEDVPNLTLTLVNRYSGEMQFGFFDLGTVSVPPGDSEFAREALSNAIVVFRLDDKPGKVFRWEAFAESEWGLFIIPRGTVKDFLDPNTSGPEPIFSIPAANPDGTDQMWSFNDLIEDVTIFAFEDVPLAWGASDKDFNDLIVAVHPAMLGALTSAASEATAGIPGAFVLSPNYPNPFNAETTIRYDLPEAGVVRLFVHNLAGQHVRTLVDGGRAAGRYSARWEGRDDAGQKMASGVYVCRMEAGGFSAVRKLMLVR